MEHLLTGGKWPLTSTSIETPIVIPCLSGTEYDHGSFTGFPERQGWNISPWSDRNFRETKFDLHAWLQTNNKSELEFPALLQSWLWFGLLETAVGFRLDRDDFIRLDADERPFLTTAKLELCFQKWRDEHEKQSGFTEASGELRADLNEAMLITWTVNRNLGYLVKHTVSSIRKVMEEIHFCTSLLWRALEVSSSKILGPHTTRSFAGNSYLPLVERYKRETGWCPYITGQLTFAPLDLPVFCYALGTARNEQNHLKCTKKKCEAIQVSPSYVVQHISPTCHCELLEPPMEELCKIIQYGNIATLQIAIEEKDPFRLSLKVEHHEISIGSSSQYFAISHVWADGLGNPNANALPECQLQKLFRSVNDAALELDLQQNLPLNLSPRFWIDTLCIPADRKFQSLRDTSIGQMHKIYKHAAGVLVLDRDLDCLSHDATFMEIMAKTIMSGWNTRLWTCQEANLASILLIRGKDCVLNVTQKLLEYQNFPDRSDADSLCHELNNVAAVSFEHHVACIRAKFLRLQRDDAQLMLSMMAHRTTSRADDEMIVVASALDLDASLITKTPSECRMVAVLKQLTEIPPGVVFSTGPRLIQKGFRWAPKSFLRPNVIGTFSVPRRFSKSWGIPDILIERPSYVLCPQGDGLMAFTPGIRLTRTGPLNVRFEVSLPNGDSYIGQYQRSADHLPHIACPSCSSANTEISSEFVILFPIVFGGSWAFLFGQHAILVEVLGETEHPFSSEIMKSVRSLHLMLIYRSKHAPKYSSDNNLQIKGDFVDPCWWLID